MKAVPVEEVPELQGKAESWPLHTWAEEVERLHPKFWLEITDDIEERKIKKFREGNTRTARKHGLVILKRGGRIFLRKMDFTIPQTNESHETETPLLED